VQVYLNGVLLNGTDYTATNGTSIVLAVAASAGDIVETVAISVNSFGVGPTGPTGTTGTAGPTGPTGPAGGGSSISVSDEGTLLTSSVTSFNFTGSGVTATAATNAVTVNIPGGGGGLTYSRTSFTATAGQTTFTVTYTVANVQVYVNGILLATNEYTATNGTSVTLGTGASLNDTVDIITWV
jgi:hypothetical protein